MHSEDTVLVPLRARDGSVRAYTVIDASDAHWVNQRRWSLTTTGYAYRIGSIGGPRVHIPLHRAIMGLQKGDKREVDHLNRNRLDNRRSNLRIVSSRSEQMQNSPAHPHGTSKYRGVSWDPLTGKWRAQLRLNGKMYRFGRFVNEADAAAAARQGRSRLMPYALD